MPLPRCRIKEAFTEYRTKVMHPESGPAQVQETRRAFYAGAGLMMEALMCALSEGPGETEGDLQVLRDFTAEIEMFQKDVLGGRA